VNSQNRMNAGAEYVVYRIWATLQDRQGIHAESLLTCLGALAGYACQACVRQTAALPGADPSKYALKADTRDGTTYLYADALNESLVESRLSVWALVSRAVRKLGEPLPDIQGIVNRVTQTVGTSEFGVPRVPAGHRPHHSASVYLKQIWPQILPIAQRFCSKPAQVPVLFGIALQRAIEQTKDVLSPTLGASIAMECAVAMSRVALPGADAAPPVAQSPAVTPPTKAAPKRVELAAARSAVESMFISAPVRRRRSVEREAPSAPRLGSFVTNLPPAVRFGAIVSLAVITIAGAMYKADRTEVGVVTAPEVRKLRVLTDATPEAQMSPQQQPAQVVDAPSPMPAEPAENPMSAAVQPPPDPASDGSAEIVIPE
jgi:hypothetical protein